MARKTNRVLRATEEDIAKIDPDNKQLLEEFMDYYVASDHSQTSCKVTLSNLRLFFVWNMQYNKDKFFAKIKRKDLLQYQSYLLKNGLSPARIRSLRSSISSLSIYIENMIISELEEDDEEYTVWKKWKPSVNSIPAPSSSFVRTKLVMNDDDVQKMLDYLVEKEQYLKACVLSLALCSGARKSELIQFKTNFFDKENLIFNGALYVTPTVIKTKGRGINGKQLQKYTLAKDFQPYLDLWMKQREELNIDSEYLFVTKGENGWEQISISTLNSYARTFTNILGTSFYWHSCRHFLCTRLSKIGFSAESIRSMYGWESVEMVKLYDDNDQIGALEKYFSDTGDIQKVEEKTLSDL